MTRSRTAAITAMLLVTSSAWAASPESQAIRPTGDNQPGQSPTERADESGNNQSDERRAGQQGERMKNEHGGSERHSGEKRGKKLREGEKEEQQGAGKSRTQPE